MIGLKRWRRPARDIALIAAFLTALSFLPPDTSLEDRQAAGFLRYCVGDVKSPLIREGETDAAGPELALMQKVAQDLGLELRLVEAKNMGRSFNPADWNISRGQCDVLGGGLGDSKANRGFGTLLPTGAHLGLVLVGTETLPPAGSEIGIYMGNSGFDRLRLSAWMRGAHYRARLLRDGKDFQTWLGKGGLAITSSLTQLPQGQPVIDLPEAAAESIDLALILWRGDTTFTRAFRQALARASNQ